MAFSDMAISPEIHPVCGGYDTPGKPRNEGVTHSPSREQASYPASCSSVSPEACFATRSVKLLFIVHHNPYAVGACLCYHCFRILHRTTRQVSGRPGVLCGHVSLWPVLRRIPFTTRARRVTPPLFTGSERGKNSLTARILNNFCITD